MKRTIKQFFNELPDGYREICLENINPLCAEFDAGKMADAIFIGINWSTSNHYNFFVRLQRYYIEVGDVKLPNLPKNYHPKPTPDPIALEVARLSPEIRQRIYVSFKQLYLFNAAILLDIPGPEFTALQKMIAGLGETIDNHSKHFEP